MPNQPQLDGGSILHLRGSAGLELERTAAHCPGRCVLAEHAHDVARAPGPQPLPKGDCLSISHGHVSVLCRDARDSLGLVAEGGLDVDIAAEHRVGMHVARRQDRIQQLRARGRRHGRGGLSE
eukprot:877637-Rhodomonas_salina.1